MAELWLRPVILAWTILLNVPRERRELGWRRRLDFVFATRNYARQCMVSGVLSVYIEYYRHDDDVAGSINEEKEENDDSVWSVFDRGLFGDILLADGNS